MDASADRSIALPAGALATVPARCTLCARHGAPAAHRIGFDLQSRPALQARRGDGNLLSTAGRLGEHAKRVKILEITEWPLCGRCVQARRLWLVVAGVLFWGGLVAIAAGVVMRVVLGEPTPLVAASFIGGLVMVLVSPAPFVAGSLPRLTRARTSVDGGFVQVNDADPRFVAEVRALLGGGS
jgi:hypothetical protein